MEILKGFGGTMSDFSRTFQPWEANFTKGLYLAGVEVPDETKAPQGWVKWTIPGYEYLCVKCMEQDIFLKVIQYIKEQNLGLTGAVFV